MLKTVTETAGFLWSKQMRCFCTHFGVEVNPQDYFNDWFHKFRFFDWYYTSKDAVKHIKRVSKNRGDDCLLEILPFLGIIYGRGYKVVALDIA